MSPYEFPEEHESEPRSGRVPDDLPDLSHDGSMDGSKVRPFDNGIYSDGRAREYVVHLLPREQPVRRDADDVRRMPSDGFPEDDESEPRRRRLLHYMPNLSHDYAVGGRQVRSRQYWVHVIGGAHDDSVPKLSREQSIRGHSDGLRKLPPAGFPEDDKSESHFSGFPDDVPDVPYDNTVDGREIRSQYDRLHFDGRAREYAVHFVPRQ